jgi:zinc D-Ala-D-Ala dipeptidase
MDRRSYKSRKNRNYWSLAICCLLATAFTCARVHAQANPPTGCNPCKKSELVELIKLDPSIKLDIRYATKNNFLGKAVYSEPRAFLQRSAAQALLSAHNWLKKYGYGLIVYDAYRPWSVTKIFWDITPIDKRIFVANPVTGSVHNRGCAVDVGLYEISTGREVKMPCNYDEMSAHSSITYKGGTAGQREMRDLLRKAMEREKLFSVYSKEWWHYDFKGFQNYPILNISFSSITTPIINNKSESNKTR